MPVENIVVSHLTVAAVTVAIINWLKTSAWFPWFTAERTRLVRIVAVAASGLGAVGIHWQWNPALHSLTITDLTFATVAGGMVAWVKSFCVQELTYQATKKTDVGELVKQMLAAMQQHPAAIIQGRLHPPTQ